MPSLAPRRAEQEAQQRSPSEAPEPPRGGASYDAVLEAVPDGICISRDGRVVYGNRAMAKLVGLGDPVEAIGRPTLDFIDATFHEDVGQGRAAAADGVLYGPSEIRLKRVDGELIPVELRVVAVDDGEGRSFLNVVRDLSAKKVAEAQALLHSTVVEQSTDGVVIANDRGRIVYANRAFCEMRDVELTAIVGRSSRDVFAAMGVEGLDVPGIVDRLLEGESWGGRYSYTDTQGEHHRDTRCFPVRDEEGRTLSIVALVRDTTPEVELEQQAEEARKLEAVAQLAGGLAHDVNNLLTVILGHVELLSVQSSGDPGVQQHSQAITMAAERSAALARQILSFARRRSLDPRMLDVNTVVRDHRSLLAALVSDRIALEFDFAASLAPVRVDPSVLQQVLTELVMNARDAIVDAGTIRITAQNENTGVALSVEDDGAGMDAQTRERAFEPFFTTRDVGAGAGLGLATVHGLVTQSGGRLEIDSEPGRGTCVRILLPGARLDSTSIVDAGAARGARDESPEGHETLLLVEDEGQLRELARRTLADAGYRVLEASNGLEALDVAAAHTEPIDLVVCDVILPGLDGVELVLRLRAERPRLRVLLMSGYAPELGPEGRAAELGALFLEKPFRMSDLRAFVREALDAPDAARSGS